MILDGGKGQLGVVKEFMKEGREFIAIGKGEARNKSAIGGHSKRGGKEVIGEKVYRFDEEGKVLEIPLVYDQADRLLLKLRDEAHRFANAYRKKQMKRENSG